MKRIRYSARRLDMENLCTYVAGFAKDLDDLDKDNEYTMLLYAGEAPAKQSELAGLEENIECTIDYDNE